MKKYIITAKNPEDIINLTLRTKDVDLSKVKWDWTHITPSEDDAKCSSEEEILDALSKGDFRSVDNMIMGGDVPVGGMVVVYDKDKPRYGFICANGIEWIVKKFGVRESNGVVYSIFNKKGEK